LLLAALVTGGVEWRIALERRREEAARQQVLTALRITSHALDRMNARLTARRHQPQD
jgi:predicted type IV restriction endonuclease